MNPPDLTPPLDREALLGKTMQRAAVLAVGRRRRRRFVQLGSAMALVVVLAATSVTVLALRGNRHTAVSPGGSSSTTTTTTTTSPDGLTPKGWVPVDYGDIQISVPASWTFVDPEACTSGAKDTVYENVDIAMSCPRIAPGPGPSVALDAWPSVEPEPTGELTINGILVFKMGPGSYRAEGVDIGLVGSGATAILRTLTYSPRFVALGSGTAPPGPKSWSWMTEPGWRIAVPSAWLAAGRTVRYPDTEGPVCSRGLTLAGTAMSTPAAFVDPDTSLGLGNHCPNLGPRTMHPPTPTDGLIINIKPIAGWPRGTPVCRGQNGVQACIVEGIPDTDILYVWGHATGEPRPMLLEIGLAGSGAIARTVLDSLRALRCPPNRLCTVSK